MPITMFLGPLGCGKTLSLTHRGLKGYAEDENLYSNYRVRFEHQIVKSPADLVSLPDNCRVLIDEAQVWFPSLMSPKHPAYEAIGVLFLRARRRGWHIDMTTQRFMNVNARVRYICDYIFCPYPYPPSQYTNPRLFEIDSWDYHTDDLLGTQILDGATVWDLYDTHGEIYGAEEYYHIIQERLSRRSLADYYTPTIARRMTERVKARS